MNLRWKRVDTDKVWVLYDFDQGLCPNKALWWDGNDNAEIWLEDGHDSNSGTHWKIVHLPKGYTEDEIKALLVVEYRMGQ